jgi:hypothetical protein
LASLAGRDAEYKDLPAFLQEKSRIYLPAQVGERLGPFPSAFGTWSLEALPPRVAAPRAPVKSGLPERAGSESAGAFAAALEEAQRRDRSGWNQMAMHYLKSRGMLADEREAWLLRYLNIRFIDLRSGS